MNPSSNKFVKLLLYILLPFALVKLLYSVALFFLPKDAVPVEKTAEMSYHYALNIANKIIQSKQPLPKKVVQVEATNRLKDIKLKGTYLDDVNSFIVIEDHLGTTFLYKGDKYLGYRLIEIYVNRAVFERNGVHYDIVINEEETKAAASLPSPSHVTNGGESVSQEKDFFEPTVVTRDEINDYIKHPNKIWSNIRIQEVRKNGQIEGFRVNYVKKGSFFEKSGLKSGDVIKAIDGKEIKSLSDVMRYYNNINNLDGLSLTVMRGENEVDLEFNIN